MEMNLIWTGFVIGLLGSIHCAGMCGPIAILLPNPGKTGNSRVIGRVVYNAGRILTYSTLGFVSGLAGKAFFLAGWQQGLSIALGLLILVGLFFSIGNRVNTSVFRVLGQIRNRLGHLLKQRSYRSLGLLGLLNGLLPCGLVWAACANAAATSSALQGMTSMFAFGFGTVPMMFILGSTGGRIQTRSWAKLRPMVTFSLAVMAVLLILRGMSLGIPYISPEMSHGNAMPNCH